MAKHASQQKNEQVSPIPDKLYFRIGDVAKLCGVEAYVLRFWETEFPQLRPNKSGTGQRLYRKRDGSPVEINQVHARTSNYGALFEKDGPKIRLKPGAAMTSNSRKEQKPSQAPIPELR